MQFNETRHPLFGRGAQALLALFLSVLVACSDGGSSDSAGDADATSRALPEATRTIAARLLTQATFGPTEKDIDAVMRLGLSGWVDDQFSLKGPPHYDYVLRYSNGSGRLPRHEIWWRDAIEGDDQLRQRVAFALSQIFVVSDTGYTLSNSQWGVTRYYDILRDNAFGNYRQLLEEVTLSPVMGIYLSMLQNARGDASANTRPDENYAREVMQLFSVGLYELNQDGSTRGDGERPLPAYTQADVETYARAFTGWNYTDADRWEQALSGSDKVSPMLPFPGFHDIDEKTFLGGVNAAAGSDERADLKIALDSLAAHPNVGPFIGAELIRKLVTSNPSPGYVSRVAATFNDNGEGVRGDMKSVIRAILLDQEAIGGHTRIANYGKLREPLLRMTHLWRAFNVQTGSNSERGEYDTITPYAENLEISFGQAPLKSPSVFNFYPPDYAPPGLIKSEGLLAPEAAIYTDDNILATTTHLNTLIQRFTKGEDEGAANLDLSIEIALAGEPSALLDRLNELLVSGSMKPGLRAILLEHLEAMPDSPDGRLARVRDAISLIMASPDYLVQM